MSKIEEFEIWAKQFIAIQDSHVREFLSSVGNMSLHEMKRLFSKRYQGEISFSYSLEVESEGAEDRIAFHHTLQKKKHTKNPHIKKMQGKGSGYGIGNRCYGYGKHLGNGKYGYGYGLGSDDWGFGFGCYGDGYNRGSGDGYGELYGFFQPDDLWGDGRGNCYGDSLESGNGYGNNFGFCKK